MVEMSPAFAPRDRELAHADRGRREAKAAGLSHILVVDDHAGSRAALEALLREEGFGTSTASDGEAALAEARREPPSLILTDLQMPGMDGVELCRRVHELD